MPINDSFRDGFLVPKWLVRKYKKFAVKFFASEYANVGKKVASYLIFSTLISELLKQPSS